MAEKLIFLNIFVKLNGSNVIEACPEQIQDGISVTCTAQQMDDIMVSRYDSTSDGVSITGTSMGDDYQKKMDRLVYEQQVMVAEGIT